MTRSSPARVSLNAAVLVAATFILSASLSIEARGASEMPATPTRAAAPVTLVSAMPLSRYRKGRSYDQAAMVPVVRQDRIAYVGMQRLMSMADTTLVVAPEADMPVAGTPVIVAELL